MSATSVAKSADNWREICECIKDNQCPICTMDENCESFDTILEPSPRDKDTGVCPNCLTEFAHDGARTTDAPPTVIYASYDDGRFEEWTHDVAKSAIALAEGGAK